MLEVGAEITFSSMLSWVRLPEQVWDWGGNGFVRYNAADVGKSQIGFVAENSVLQTAFHEATDPTRKAASVQIPCRSQLITKHLILIDVLISKASAFLAF